MFPVLFDIPNAWEMAGSALTIEIVIGLVAFLAWLALHLKGRRDWVAANLNTVAVLVVLHLALSHFMEPGREITIYSFGVIIILGFLAGARFMMGQTDQLGLDRKKVFDWAFWMLVVGIIGARLLYAFLNYEQFADNKMEVLRIWNGGLVWYGGMIPAILVGIFLLLRHKLPVLHVLDVGAAAVILALGIGRWACLMAGDDYGRVVDENAWYGIRFYNDRALVPASLRGMPLHPTQLYMSINCLWMFWMIEWVRRRAKFAGQAFAAMLVMYAVSRALWIEPFRGDFVERNPAYGRHVAAELSLSKGENSPALSLKAGDEVTGNDRTGRLLADVTLPAGEGHTSVWAISDERAKPEAQGRFVGAPQWPIDKIASLKDTTGVTVSAPGSSRWYGSDLPVPPNYVSTSQWISIFVVLAGIGVFLLGRGVKEHGFAEAVVAHAKEKDREPAEPA